MDIIKTRDDLRRVYPEAKGRSVEKQLSELDAHMRNFISKSPFVVMATYGKGGLCDSTPRGGLPGFVKVKAGRLLLPDWPGNNRLDSFENILENPGVGLLFLIPGVNETLRVNGTAVISVGEKHRTAFDTDGKLPRAVLCIDVIEAYLHCAKALMRAELWDERTKIERTELPTIGQMLKDQIGSPDRAETQSEMEARYRKLLY